MTDQPTQTDKSASSQAGSPANATDGQSHSDAQRNQSDIHGSDATAKTSQAASSHSDASSKATNSDFAAGAHKAAGATFSSNTSNHGNSQAQANQMNSADHPGNADLIMSIPVEVQVVLGGTTMPVATLMNLGRGAVITLDKQIGDPVDIVVNGRVIARGEVIVMEDDSSRFGVSLTEIIGK